MLLVDSQVHIWGADTPERPWPALGSGGRNVHVQRAEPLGADELLAQMDSAGVDRAIIVPPSWEGERNDLALEAAQRHPQRFAIMGRIGMDDSRNRALLRDWRRQPGMLGIRLVFSESASWLREAERHWLWAAAEEAGVPVTLFPMSYYALLETLLERYPELRLCIDHMGCIAYDPAGTTFAHLPQLLRLARFPNVAVKATTLPNYSVEPYPFPSVHEPLRRVVDAFGAQRVFWGSDLSRLRCSYRELVALFTEELRWLSREDLEWIMGRGVCEWYGWSCAPSTHSA